MTAAHHVDEQVGTDVERAIWVERQWYRRISGTDEREADRCCRVGLHLAAEASSQAADPARAMTQDTSGLVWGPKARWVQRANCWDVELGVFDSTVRRQNQVNKGGGVTMILLLSDVRVPEFGQSSSCWGWGR